VLYTGYTILLRATCTCNYHFVIIYICMDLFLKNIFRKKYPLKMSIALFDLVYKSNLTTWFCINHLVRNQRLSRACIVHLVIKRTNWSYVKTMSCSGSRHSINTGPYGENTEIYSSLKLLHWLNLNCASIIGRCFTNFVFFMLIVIPRWLKWVKHLYFFSLHCFFQAAYFN
jgi:hypothetical protein